MYSVILLAAMTSGEGAAAIHKRGYAPSNCAAVGCGGGARWHNLSHGSYGPGYGGCYGIGYTGWVGYGGWSHPHAAAAGVPSPGTVWPTEGWGAPYGGDAGFGPGYCGEAGWGRGYAGYWPGYACAGGCGGYASFAYGGAGTYGDFGGPAVVHAGMAEARRPAAARELHARLEVELPRGARLYVDDREVKGNDTSRGFRTPALEKGEKYYYDLRAEVEVDGQTVTSKRRVVVTAGQTARADFREMGAAVGVASAKGE